MLIDLVSHYPWWIIALVLLIAELLAPGFFMIWISLAAALVGLVVLLLPSLGLLGQALLFVVLALASCYGYWGYVRPHMDRRSDQPLLNRRGEQLIGQRYVLDSAIVNGRGKARVGDSLWLVEGPDLPAGSTVEVLGVAGTTLRVQSSVG